MKQPIGSVYDSVGVQTGDVPLPENDALLTWNGWQVGDMDDAFFLPLLPEQFILHIEEILP